MGVVYSKVFRSGNSEAVRLPKEIAYGEDIEVTLRRVGESIIITPKRKRTVAEMVARLREIGQPADGVQLREPFEAPERQGL